MAEATKSTIFTKALAIAIIGTPILLYLQLHDSSRQRSADLPVGSLQVTTTAGYACPTRDLLDHAASDGAAALVSNGGSCFMMPPGIKVRIATADSTIVQFQLDSSPSGGLMWTSARSFSH